MADLIRENHFKVPSDSSLVSFLVNNTDFIKSEQQVLDFAQEKRLLVNDICVKVDVPLKAGDSITLLTPQSKEPKVNHDVKIIFEDDSILVVDKPAPLPMHPAGRYYFNTLTSILERKFQETKLFSVHRLDSETSGLVIFAKSSVVANNLRKQLLSKSVEKVYVAIVFGTPNPVSGVIDQPLIETTYGDIRNKMLPSDVGHVARTNYEVLQSSPEKQFSLVKLQPKTGKKHQLRVHLASIGHPIVGDKVYGAHPNLFAPYVDNPANVAPEILEKLLSLRHFLHCEQLSFLHPKTGKSVSFQAGIGQDMVEFMKRNSI